MNLKKMVCLTMALVFALAPVVGAADDVCNSCKSPKNVLVYSPEQAGCERITYENQWGKRWGYSEESDSYNAKLVFSICSCPNTNSYFRKDQIVGIKITILTDGVYWTNESLAIQPFQSEEAACKAAAGTPAGVTVANDDGVIGPALAAGTTSYSSSYRTALPNIIYSTTNKVFYPGSDDAVNRVFLPAMRIVDDQPFPSEGYDVPQYWRPSLSNTSYIYTPETSGFQTLIDGNQVIDASKRVRNENAEYVYYKADGTKLDRTDLLNPLYGIDADCIVEAGEQAKVLQINRAYQIGYIDDKYNLCNWFIDLPQMAKNFSEIKPNDTVDIRIDILYDPDQGLCATPKIICTCNFTIGIFGDDTRSMYFPYVFTGISPWVTGIVVTNMDTVTTPVSNMTATFTLMDSTGKKFTYSKKDFQASVWPVMLDSIVDKFDGTPKEGAGWLKVDTNFKVDGYQFVTDGVYGAGTLPRLPGYTSAPFEVK